MEKKWQFEDHKAMAKAAGGVKHISFIAWKLREIADVSGFPDSCTFSSGAGIVNRIKILKIKNKS